LGLKGTREHPKRKTHRRWWIAAAAVHLRLAMIDRVYFGDRKGALQNMAHAVYCRRMAMFYGRTDPERPLHDRRLRPQDPPDAAVQPQ
jgi:hypothetical protein